MRRNIMYGCVGNISKLRLYFVFLMFLLGDELVIQDRAISNIMAQI